MVVCQTGYIKEDSLTFIDVENGRFEKHEGAVIVKVTDGTISKIKLKNANDEKINICTITKEDSMNLWNLNFKGKERIVLCKGTLICIDEKLKIQNVDKEEIDIYIFPPINKEIKCKNAVIEQLEDYNVFNKYNIKVQKKEVTIEVKKIKDSKATINISEDQFQGLKDIMLRINYEGDIGYSFINGDLISDNFCNGSIWEILLNRFKERRNVHLYISNKKW